MDSAAIQELVICPSEELAAVAKKHDLTTPRAKVVRDHWLRRITSHCVQCNALVVEGKCPRCKTPKQLPREIIVRRECECGRVFYYSVGYILKMFKQKGAFEPSNKCSKCLNKAKGQIERRSKKKVMAKRDQSKTKRVKSTRPKNPKERKESRGLTYRPFAALKGVKVKK